MEFQISFCPQLPFQQQTQPVLVILAELLSADATQAGGVTGVIIDARGLKARPAMAPRILDQNGNAIYGPGKYSRKYAVENGVVGYSKTLEAAQKDQRVVGNPIVVKGLVLLEPIARTLPLVMPMYQKSTWQIEIIKYSMTAECSF